MANEYDPLRLSVALNSAILEGSWNPTAWLRSLLGHLDAALRLSPGDADQNAYRAVAARIATSSLLVHLRSEVDDGMLPASIVAVALVETTQQGHRLAEPAPEMPWRLMAA